MCDISQCFCNFTLCRLLCTNCFLDINHCIRHLNPSASWVYFNRHACCCSIAKSGLTLCDPMDCSTPGFPVLHYLPEFAQTHVHWVSDAIQPSFESVMPSNHLILCHHLLLLPSVFPSIRFFFFSKFKMGVFHRLIFSIFFLAALCGCGILVPQPGIEPSPPLLEGQSTNHWTTREVPHRTLLKGWAECKGWHTPSWFLKAQYPVRSVLSHCKGIWVGVASGTEKAMAPHSSTLAWKIPCKEEPGRLWSMGSLRVRHDWATSLSLLTFMH